MAKDLPGKPEHVPVASYHLLRRLDERAIASATLFGAENEYAVQFLVSRGLARRSGSFITITPGGRSVGEIGEGHVAAGTAEKRSHSGSSSSTKTVPIRGLGKPLSETLQDASLNLDHLSRAHVLILIRQAIRVLQLGENEARELVDAANDDSGRFHVRH